MSSEQTKAAMRRPPHSTDGIQITVAGPGAVTLPTKFKGQWVQAKCVSGSCRLLFGDPAVTVAVAAVSGDANFGYPMTSGDKEDWELTEDDVRIAFDGAAAVLEIWLNGGKGN